MRVKGRERNKGSGDLGEGIDREKPGAGEFRRGKTQKS